MKIWSFYAVCTVSCRIGLAEGRDDGTMKAWLDQVASSYTASDGFMGTVLVAKRDRILRNMIDPGQFQRGFL
jgi:hypothetical protein